MNPRPVPHRKPDLLMASILLVVMLLPPTMALQLRMVQADEGAAIDKAPVLVQMLPGESPPVDSGGDASAVARHPSGGIQRHL
jgi:hypothetical protein